MPEVGPGRIFYPGVLVPLECSFALGHGCRPSQGTLTFLSQPGSVPSRGDLTMECDGKAVTFRHCLIDVATYEYGGQGKVVTARLFDRRIDWQDAAISGEYNIRKPDNSFEPGSERTPQELATLLCQAFGEPQMDISALPNDSRPYVAWDNASAADELDNLCDLLNCRVVLKKTDESRIVRLNVGEPLPRNELQLYVGTQIDPPEAPDILRLAGDYVRRQVRLPLEAVGEDIDGKVKPLNELLFKPQGGWEKEWPDLPSISIQKTTRPDGSRASPQDIYRQSVYRWYRVKETGIKIPDLSKSDPSLDDEVLRWQIRPLGSELAEEWADADGRKHPRPAYCIGDWYGYTLGDATVDTIQNNNNVKVPIGFSVDPERCIVQFSDAVYLLGETDGNADGRVLPAKLWLHVAVVVKHPKTRAPERYYKDRRIGRGGGNRIRTISHDDVKLVYRGQYSRDDSLTGNPDNLPDCSRIADYYLDAAARQFVTFPGEDSPYVGIQSIDVDGAIQQVTWQVVQGQGASTRASRGGEHNLNVPSYTQAKDDRNRVIVEQLARKAAAEDKKKLQKG